MKLQNVTAADVAQVYSGKQGCMCGCKGKYFDSGKMIAKVLNILKSDARTVASEGMGADCGSIIHIDDKLVQRDSERNYVVYLKAGRVVDAPVDLFDNLPIG